VKKSFSVPGVARIGPHCQMETLCKSKITQI